MDYLIRQAFLHVEVIGPHVAEGHYDLVGPNGEIILPQVWETVLEPDWTVTMHMWPMPEPPKPEELPPLDAIVEVPPPDDKSAPPPPPPPPSVPEGDFAAVLCLMPFEMISLTFSSSQEETAKAEGDAFHGLDSRKVKGDEVFKMAKKT